MYIYIKVKEAHLRVFAFLFFQDGEGARDGDVVRERSPSSCVCVFPSLFLSLIAYNSHHNSKAQSRETVPAPRRQQWPQGQKRNRGIRPGRRRYREVLLPERSLVEEESSERLVNDC